MLKPPDHSWGRLWIIQEVALASEIVIQCGNDTFPWSHFEQLFKMVGDIVARGRKISSGLQGATSLSNLVGNAEGFVRTLETCTLARLISDRNLLIAERSKWGRNDIEHPLLRLCIEFGHARCEDQRDKVFGLREIASKCCQLAAPVDYTLSMAQIAGMILHHHVFEHAHLGMGPIGDSRQFHQKLGITPKIYGFPLDGLVPLSPVVESPVASKPRLITVATYVRGRISFVSPPLDEKISKWKLETPNMSYVLRSQLRHIIEQRGKYGNRPLAITRQLDLVLRSTAEMTSNSFDFHGLPPVRIDQQLSLPSKSKWV